MKASLQNHRQSVRKAKLMADLVRGKDVSEIKDVLRFTDKKAAPVFQKLIDSAVANARAQGIDESTLYVKTVTVNKGVEYKRYMPRARGRAAAVRRGASHIAITLGTRGGAAKQETQKAETKAPAKKAAAKKTPAKKTTAKKEAVAA